MSDSGEACVVARYIVCILLNKNALVTGNTKAETVPEAPVAWLGPMKELSNHQQAVELLQQLGLKEYEAKCFVALSRLPKGTAKDISETSDVPRTRVYDAVRVLESKGLVEVQHSNPQQFRAVSVIEGVETLRQEYEDRMQTLVDVLEELEPALTDTEEETSHEVWSISGSTTIENRTRQLIDAAENEIVLVVGHPSVISEDLITHLQLAREGGTRVLVGTVTDDITARLSTALPEVEIFTSELEWLRSSPTDTEDNTTITRLLLVDKNTILVSSLQETSAALDGSEKAVFGRGFDNGLVVIARRLMATGL